jgi:hypothetical protein
MGQYVSDVDSPEEIVDLSNKPVLVAFDVEHSPFLHSIGACEGLAYICQILPKCFFCDPKPDIQCRFEFGVPQRRFFQLLAADYVRDEFVVRIMRI